jgi:ATP-dependent Clp protease ATP-binding subunit ClpC
MRQEKFTEQAQEALSASQELVRTYKHNQWDIEHILMALLQQEKGLIVDLLKTLGVNIDSIRQQVESTLERMPKVSYEAGQIYATPRIQWLFQAADAEAKRLKDEFIGTEHLLIAMSSEPRGEAANILRNVGVDQEKVYSRRTPGDRCPG